MRATSVFFAYLLCCFALAAGLTYPLLQAGWVDAEPQTIMGRLTQAFILLGLLPFLRWLRLADRTSLGYGVAGPSLRRAVAMGWWLGVAMLLAQALVMVQMGMLVAVPLPSWAFLAKKAEMALMGGLVVGFLEETFFRGALFSAIRRQEGLGPAVIGSAALYSAAHFLKPVALPDGVPFDWSGALAMFTHVFVDGVPWQHLDSLTAVFAAGVLLALVRERTGHIGWCIGLHAGWVLVIQVTRRVTDVSPASDLAVLVGGYDDFIGWLAVAWIGVLTLVYWNWSGLRLTRCAA